MARRVRGRPVVFYPRVGSVLLVSLGCWVLAAIVAWTSVDVVSAGEVGFAFIFWCFAIYFAGLGLYFPSLRLAIDADGVVRYDTVFFALTFWPREVRERRADGSWILRFDSGGGDAGGKEGTHVRMKFWHLGGVAFLLQNLVKPDGIVVGHFLWGVERRPELVAVLRLLRRKVRAGKYPSSAAPLAVLSTARSETLLARSKREAVRSVRGWWKETGWIEKLGFLVEKFFRGGGWVFRKVFEGLVWFLELVFDWKEAGRPYDISGEGLKARPIVFRPAMAALVAFWVFFGLLEGASVVSFLSVWPEGDEIERQFWGLSSVTWIWFPVWESCLRLRIRPDGRFVYDTLFYSISFLPTAVREKRKGSHWVLAFDPKAVDPQGRPSVVFRAKRWWVGKLVLWVRQEFGGNEVEFSSGTWKLKKGSYMLEVFTALREAVREGKQVRLW